MSLITQSGDDHGIAAWADAMLATRGSREIAGVDKLRPEPPRIYWGLGCPHHYGQRRGRSCAAMAREAGRGGAARLLGEPSGPAGAGDGALKPPLVREDDGAGHQRRPALDPP